MTNNSTFLAYLRQVFDVPEPERRKPAEKAHNSCFCRIKSLKYRLI